MTLKPYKLDKYAHDLVLKYRDKDVLNETHKMRMTVAYGLERFWAEQFRLEKDKNQDKAKYWRETWKTLAKIMKQAKVIVPNDDIDSKNTNEIQEMAKKLWAKSDQDLDPNEKQKSDKKHEFNEDQRKVTLAVLTQLCDYMVWWVQRYKR
ncbi:MAG: hypothetical protein MGG11_18375 [Trichodesmium sp. MAG_R03]|nr:hypothetical protein [Trichodesmium sp. MAG_R03]